MICKKCGAELGRQDKCPKCGFINGYNVKGLPAELREIDTLLAKKMPAKPVRPVTLTEQKRAATDSEAVRQTPLNEASAAEKYLGKAPQPEFRHTGRKKGKKHKKKYKLYLLGGMAAFLIIGFLLGLLLGWRLWYSPKTEEQAETVQQSDLYYRETVNTEHQTDSETSSEADQEAWDRLNPGNMPETGQYGNPGSMSETGQYGNPGNMPETGQYRNPGSVSETESKLNQGVFIENEGNNFAHGTPEGVYE